MTISTGAIPAWNSAGVIPPIRPGVQGHDLDRSPYFVDLVTVVDRFATSPERCAILDGLLRYRSIWHQAGISSGFQWLDGSFLEQIETLESRPPKDMDVVTFFDLPDGDDQRSFVRNNPELFDRKKLKDDFYMDAYFSPLGGSFGVWQVKNISYWYSMWSHRRNGLWKGFVQVDIDPSQDSSARAILDANGGIHP